MRNISLILLLALCACKTTSPSAFGSLQLYLNGSSTKSVSELKLKKIKNIQSPFLVNCKFSVHIEGEYEANCKSELARFIEIANTQLVLNKSGYIFVQGPIKKGGICFDTFVPGREAADCFEYLEANIEIRKI